MAFLIVFLNCILMSVIAVLCERRSAALQISLPDICHREAVTLGSQLSPLLTRSVTLLRGQHLEFGSQGHKRPWDLLLPSLESKLGEMGQGKIGGWRFLPEKEVSSPE